MKRISPNDMRIKKRTSAPKISIPPPPVNCERCRDSGYYTLDVDVFDPQFGKLQACDCAAYQAQIADRQASIHNNLTEELGDQYSHCTFDSFHVNWSGNARLSTFLDKVKTFCMAYAESLDGWLLLHGKAGGYCGGGKSHLAAAIANTAATRGITVAYATVPDLFAYIMRDWAKSDERIERLGSVGLLVMDDAGKEAVKGGGVAQFQDKFFRILGTRDRKNLPTIITSNYSIEELAKMEQYEPAVISRITGKTKGNRIFMQVPDYRSG
jgi:DNA replication protein DnaC